jgi:uncharacterized membrane protein
MSIIAMSVAIFILQLVFVWLRTLNIQYIANKDLTRTLISGTVIHILWLLTVAIGIFSITEIMQNFELKYLPVVVCSCLGSMVGTLIALKK